MNFEETARGNFLETYQPNSSREMTIQNHTNEASSIADHARKLGNEDQED